MYNKKTLKMILIAGILLILLALLLWVEFSFVLAGLGLMTIGIGILLYVNKK